MQDQRTMSTCSSKVRQMKWHRPTHVQPNTCWAYDTALQGCGVLHTASPMLGVLYLRKHSLIMLVLLACAGVWCAEGGL